MKSPTEAEQRAIRKRAAEKMRQSREALNSMVDPELYRTFLDEFAIVETGYKSLLLDYLKDTSGGVPKQSELKIEIRQVERVLEHAGVMFNDIDEVFSGKNAKGNRKARALRNSLAHSPNESALSELAQNKSSLFSAMTAFEEAVGCDSPDNHPKGA